MKFGLFGGSPIAHLAAALALAGLAVLPAHGGGTNVQYLYNATYTANSVAPNGSGPWVSATFAPTTGGLLLTISNLNLSGPEKIDVADFNLNPSLNVNNLTFSLQSQVGSFLAPTITKGEDAFKAGGDGYYDFELAFNTTTAGAFDGGESVTYLLSGIPNLSTTDFAYLSTPGSGNNPGPFYAAIHVLNTGANNNKSAWLEPGSGPTYLPVPVPEPGTGALAALALGLWAAVRHPRRRSQP